MLMCKFQQLLTMVLLQYNAVTYIPACKQNIYCNICCHSRYWNKFQHFCHCFTSMLVVIPAVTNNNYIQKYTTTMVKTDAERQRECRQRRKDAGLHEAMKAKDRERQRRKKQQMNSKQLKILKERNRLAKLRFKHKQKLLKEQQIISTSSASDSISSSSGIGVDKS